MGFENNSFNKIDELGSDTNLYQYIFNEATEAIFIGNKKGNFLRVNTVAERLTGYSKKELTNMKMSDLFPKNVLEKNPLNYDDVLSGETIIMKRYIKRKDGASVFVEMKSKMLSDGNLISFFSDATLQLELEKSEQKYNEIIENINEAIVILQDNKLKFANKNTAKLLGYSYDEIIDKPFLNFVHPGDRELILKNHLARLQGECNVSNSYNFRLYSKTGKTIWAETNPIVIEYEGKPAVQGFFIDITEKKKDQIALEKSESRFRNLVENMEEGITAVGLNQKILYVSPGTVKILGYSAEELIGKNFTEFIFEDDIPYVKRVFSMNIENKIEFSEFRVTTKEGNVIWIRSSSKPTIEKGKVVGVSVVMIDINSRKKTEDSLKKSEMMYRNLIDNSPVGIIIHQNSEIIYINTALQKMTGYYNLYDVINKSLFQFLPEEFHKTIQERIKNIMEKKGKSKLSEIKIIAKNGKTIDVLFLGQYILFEGSPSIQVYVYDISEFNKYKTDVDKLSRAVAQTTSAVLIYNFVGVVEYANSAAEKLTGFAFEKIKDKKRNIFKALQITKENISKISSTVTSGKEWSGEFSIITQNGKTIELQVVVSPIVNNSGKITHFVSIAEDITAKKGIEKKLQLAKNSAEKSDQLKSNFLAQMSHEIRTPINAIVSFVGLLKNDLYNSLDEDQRISFGMIEKAGGRIIRTIELLLNYSELKANAYQPSYTRIEINSEILAQFALEYRRQAKIKKIKFYVTTETENSFFYGDRHGLEQILSNLIDNAIKYTNEGSVEVRLFKNDFGKLTVTIKDTGTGIAKDYLKNIFNPFSQEEAGYTRSFEGNGIGLALVKEYCEMNAIKISVESTKNIGTTFTLVF